MPGRPIPEPSSQIAEANAGVRLRLPFADTEEFDDARRGFVGSLSEPVVKATDGRVLWDADGFDAECPDTSTRASGDRGS